MAARRGPQDLRTGDGGVELVDRDAVDRDRDGDILWRARKRVSARYGHACSRERGTYVEEVRPRLDVDVEAEVVEQDLDAALQLLLAGAELVLGVRARISTEAAPPQSQHAENAPASAGMGPR